MPAPEEQHAGKHDGSTGQCEFDDNIDHIHVSTPIGHARGLPSSVITAEELQPQAKVPGLASHDDALSFACHRAPSSTDPSDGVAGSQDRLRQRLAPALGALLLAGEEWAFGPGHPEVLRGRDHAAAETAQPAVGFVRR
jgi:hypothetical protein